MASYVYSAAGGKLSVSYQTGTGNTSTQYCGNIIYDNNNLSQLLIDGGYITFSGTTPQYHYYLQDHLGSNRVVVNESGTAEQVTHYYPFGGIIADLSTGQDIQKYKYNGKELDVVHGLNTYDYGARQYYSILGRWDRMDPLCEKYYSLSPYNYCGNNPIRFIDPTGEEGIKYIDENGNKVIESNVVVLLEKKRAIPSDADNKSIQRLIKLNNKIENRNSHRLQTIREQLDETYSDAVDTHGNHVSFKFNVIGIETDNPNLNRVSQYVDIAIRNGLPAITTDRIEGAAGYGVATAAVISQASAGSALGVASGGLIRLNDRSATTLAHEIGHTLGLADSYGHGNGRGEGIMGSPPTTLLPSEVDKIWEKAYERKQ
jgi:RHS repeat-associated protein